MTVFVDQPIHPYKNMLMCHLWADGEGTYDPTMIVTEMHWMVDKIRVDRKWIQGHKELSLPRYKDATWVHFDIAKTKRVLAISYGAIETDRFGPMRHKIEVDVRSGIPQLMERGVKNLRRLQEREARIAVA